MLAIVIPYFKAAFFRETLQSLANQSDKRFRVYIGNDASPENPVSLIEDFNGSLEISYQEFDTNMGGVSLVKQWERCIALVQEETWVLVLGDDDVLGPEVVSEFYRQYASFDPVCSVVRYATVKIDSQGNETSGVYEYPQRQNAVDFLFNKTRSSLSEYIFRKDQINRIGFRDFPLAWSSDVMAVLEFSNFGLIHTINQARVYVRISELNISGKSDNLRQKVVATFSFYEWLLTRHEAVFSKDDIHRLELRFNKSYAAHKKNVRLFFRISQYYVSKFKFRQYLNFLKGVVIAAKMQ